MNIKQEIGKRIAKARKALGLTVKELADKTKSLKQSRISNWERGARTPGPSEILQLSDVLKIDPAYLLCLSDIKQPQDYERKLIPILSLTEAVHYEELLQQELTDRIQAFDHLLMDRASHLQAFAIKIDDKSMSPEFEVGDIVIIDSQRTPSPGKYVLVHLKDDHKAILRKYRLTSDTTQPSITFELIPLNPDWPTLVIKDIKSCAVLGVCIEHRRYSD